MSKIFGYDWKDIQAAQQGNSSALHRPVEETGDFGAWTVIDQHLLDQYQSIEALEAAGLYGVADRAKRHAASTLAGKEGS